MDAFLWAEKHHYHLIKILLTMTLLCLFAHALCWYITFLIIEIKKVKFLVGPLVFVGPRYSTVLEGGASSTPSYDLSNILGPGTMTCQYNQKQSFEKTEFTCCRNTLASLVCNVSHKIIVVTYAPHVVHMDDFPSFKKTVFICFKQHGWKVTSLLLTFYSEINLTEVFSMATGSSHTKIIKI